MILHEHLLSELKKTAQKVNDVLLSAYKVEPKILDDSATHILATGGKRVRPFITINTCRALGGNAEQGLPAAAAVEFIHNFSMIHDDIMDNDPRRHGAPTVHVKYGTPMAILAGDVLFAKAFAITSEQLGKAYPPEAAVKMVNTLAKTSITLCEGQALDMILANSNDIPSVEQYMTVIERKTAALVSAAAQLGALAANAQPEAIQSASSYGRNLGLAFQIVDDLLSLVGDESITGKPVGSDLREGKKTLPIILVFKNPGSQVGTIQAVWGVRSSNEEGIREALKQFKRLAIEKTVRGIAEDHAKEARKAISSLQDSRAKGLLNELTGFVVRREY